LFKKLHYFDNNFYFKKKQEIFLIFCTYLLFIHTAVSQAQTTLDDWENGKKSSGFKHAYF